MHVTHATCTYKRCTSTCISKNFCQEKIFTNTCNWTCSLIGRFFFLSVHFYCPVLMMVRRQGKFYHTGKKCFHQIHVRHVYVHVDLAVLAKFWSSKNYQLQWNPTIPDTLGKVKASWLKKVFSFRGSFVHFFMQLGLCMASWLREMSSFQGRPYRGVLLYTVLTVPNLALMTYGTLIMHLQLSPTTSNLSQAL